MNNLDFTDLIEALSAVMLTLSALAAFFAAKSSRDAVFEMQASRKASEKPVLHTQERVNIACLHLCEKFQPEVFSLIENDVVRPGIVFRNIGLGNCYETTFSFSDNREPLSLDDISPQSIDTMNRLLSKFGHVIEKDEFTFSISSKRGGATRFGSLGYHAMQFLLHEKFPKFSNQIIEAKDQIRCPIPEKIFLDRFIRMISGYVNSEEFADGRAYQEWRSHQSDFCIDVRYRSISGEEFTDKVYASISCHIWGKEPRSNALSIEKQHSASSEFQIKYYIDIRHKHRV